MTRQSREGLSVRFEEVAALRRNLDIEQIWGGATDQERRVLIDELVDEVAMLPDHLEVKVAGVPPLNVTYQEVGLAQSEIGGVGEGT